MTPQEYEDAYQACNLVTDPTRVLEARAACKVIITNELTYWGVEKATGVPWLVVAAIHYRESNQNFKCHLHNGDPLNARTVHVPAGRPTEGNPPFTWTASAIDALSHQHIPFEWTLGAALDFCERYNGLGYQKHGVASPYVWSGTDKYVGGLFVADGTLDITRKDARPGIAALFKTLSWMGARLEFKTGLDAPNIVLH